MSTKSFFQGWCSLWGGHLGLGEILIERDKEFQVIIQLKDGESPERWRNGLPVKTFFRDARRGRGTIAKRKSSKSTSDIGTIFLFWGPSE